jgi:hypothetical protein
VTIIRLARRIDLENRKAIAPSTGPTRVGASEDEGRAILRNVVVLKQGDDGESPKFKK